MALKIWASLALLCVCHSVLVEAVLAEVGDPVRGQAVFLDRDLGHCVLCHQVSSLGVPFQGNIGPDLSNVGQRLSRKDLWDKIADPTVSNSESTMPAYHRTSDLRQVQPEYLGKPILSQAELNDLVAYLQTLRDAP
ncbi:MAG: sulfur oxidation c-type cytochrome SoxX [Pseudomonadota bacterium]